MADRKKYLLDANVFIEASHRYYGFDTCPGFWKALIREHKKHSIFSIDRVKKEIVTGKNRTKDEPDREDDDLALWAKNAPDSFFKKTEDIVVIEWYGKIINWIQQESQYQEEAKAFFNSGADGWLIAYAKANHHTIVTLEVFSPESKKSVKIPNVCHQFNIECIDTFEMLRKLNISFGLLRSK